MEDRSISPRFCRERRGARDHAPRHGVAAAAARRPRSRQSPLRYRLRSPAAPQPGRGVGKPPRFTTSRMQQWVAPGRNSRARHSERTSRRSRRERFDRRPRAMNRSNRVVTPRTGACCSITSLSQTRTDRAHCAGGDRHGSRRSYHNNLQQAVRVGGPHRYACLEACRAESRQKVRNEAAAARRRRLFQFGASFRRFGSSRADRQPGERNRRVSLLPRSPPRIDPLPAGKKPRPLTLLVDGAQKRAYPPLTRDLLGQPLLLLFGGHRIVFACSSPRWRGRSVRSSARSRKSANAGLDRRPRLRACWRRLRGNCRYHRPAVPSKEGEAPIPSLSTGANERMKGSSHLLVGAALASPRSMPRRQRRSSARPKRAPRCATVQRDWSHIVTPTPEGCFRGRSRR